MAVRHLKLEGKRASSSYWVTGTCPKPNESPVNASLVFFPSPQFVVQGWHNCVVPSVCEIATWRPNGVLCAIIASIWRNRILKTVVLVRWNCCCCPWNLLFRPSGLPRVYTPDPGPRCTFGCSAATRPGMARPLLPPLHAPRHVLPPPYRELAAVKLYCASNERLSLIHI